MPLRRFRRPLVAAGVAASCVAAVAWGCFDPERIHIEPEPPNDTCAGANDLGEGGVFAGDTGPAGDDHEPVAGCGAPGGRDVWFRFTLDAPEVVYLDTVDGNTWDSVLVLYGGTCGDLARPPLCADDQCPGESGGRRSQLVERLEAGSYVVVVDGRDAAAAGPFALRFQRAACAGAIGLPGNGAYDGNSMGWDDRFRGSCGEPGVPDTTYYLGLCAPREVTASTCGSMERCDSILTLAAGGCEAADELACNDDDDTCRFGMGRSTVTATLPQGLNFLILESRSPPGPYRLTVSGM